MNETMASKMARLTADPEIYKISIRFKCKTKDGMTYTLLTNEYQRKEVPYETKTSDELSASYAEWIMTCVTQEIVHITDIIEKTDGFWISLDEVMSIKHSEIVRVWAELGDIYTTGPIK